MKKYFTIALFLISSCLYAQRKVVIDTLNIGGKASAYTITNWYCIEGDKCPKFKVFDENGKSLESKDLLGKTVLISFWMQSCAPCRKEISRVGSEIIDKYTPDELAVVAIGVKENQKGAKLFRSLSNASFPLYYDESGEVFQKFADNGVPKLFLIDSKGIVQLIEKGYNDEKFNHLKTIIDRLIKANRK